MGYINMYTMGGLAAIVAVSYQLGLVQFTNVTSVLVYLGVTLFGFGMGFVIVMFSGKKRKISINSSASPAANVLVMKVMEVLSRKQRRPRGTVFSRSMDKAIKEVFDLVQRDFVLSWYSQLGQDTGVFTSALEEDMWEFLENLFKRLKNIDKVRFFTSDVVFRLCDHFAELRETTVRDSPKPKPFLLHPCLVTEDAEREFLREAVEVMLVLMLPAGIANSDTARHLLREIVTCGVFKPTVDRICDPYFVNSMLVSFLEHRETLAENHKRKYAYAASYEEFIKLINMCNEVQELQQIRYHIITEIMHATMIQDLKKARGPDVDKSSKSSGKVNLLRVRNLKRYINQCKVAKVQCERRLGMLGGPEYYVYNWSTHPKPLHDLRPQRVLTLDEILSDKVARAYLNNFLRKDGKDDLLNFCTAVEKLRDSKKPQDQHMYANEIYQTYLATTSAVKVDRMHTKGMADFLAANKGPESFYSAQLQVYQELDETYYPSFLVSESYTKLMSALGDHQGNGKEAKEELSPEVLEKKGFNTKVKPQQDGLPEAETSFAEQTMSVVSKLQQVEKTLANKEGALRNLNKAHSADAKMQQMLEKETEQLRLEKAALETYIERTDLWCDHVGKWRTDICSVQVLDESDKVVPYYVIVVHPTDPSISTEGWVVSRRLGDFHALQQRLKECSKWVGKMKLPQINKKILKLTDQDFLSSSKDILQKFLTSILQDETLRHSEVLYTFLVPTPECLRATIKEEKKEKKSVFSFAGIFKSSGDQDDERQTDDAEGEEEGSQDRWDSTAEPIYSLISEVFELHGMFKWLRKKLIFFVQSTFGGTINKQLRETVEWITSESMLIYYIRILQKSVWPDGKLAPSPPVPTKDERIKMKTKAKEKFLQYFPDFLQSLLGKKNSQLGAIKVFDALQDTRTNRHLVYNLIELTLIEVCPELKDPKLLEHLEEEERSQNEQRRKDVRDAAKRKEEERADKTTDDEDKDDKEEEDEGIKDEEEMEASRDEDIMKETTKEDYKDEGKDEDAENSNDDDDDEEDKNEGTTEDAPNTDESESVTKETEEVEELGAM